MPNQPTDDNEGAGFLFNLARRGVDLVQHRRGCGCLTELKQNAELNESLVIFSPCGDPIHTERLGLFWRVIAHAHDYTFGLELPDGESVRELPCGCRWTLKPGLLKVYPCEKEHHGEVLGAVSREFCAERGIECEEEEDPE